MTSRTSSGSRPAAFRNSGGSFASVASAQFGRGGFFGFAAPVAKAEDFDGRFHYCRAVYRQARDGAGGSWRTDYPRADINMSIRLSELTRTSVSFDGTAASIAPIM